MFVPAVGMPERPSPRYKNDLRRLNMYQFCNFYFIIITLIEIIIIAMFTICIIFFYIDLQYRY